MHDHRNPSVLTVPADDKLAALAFWAIDALLLHSEEDLSHCEDEDAYRADLGELIATARGYRNVAAWNGATEAGNRSFTLPESEEGIEEARSGELTSRRVDDFLR